MCWCNSWTGFPGGQHCLIKVNVNPVVNTGVSMVHIQYDLGIRSELSSDGLE
jgi:hypothetical protein